MANPSVAIVILNYNGRRFLQQFLPSVLQSTFPNKRIVVADNCSTDDSLDFLASFNGIEVIQLDKNYGFAEGYNKALQKVQSDYYVLLNSDVEVTTSWLEPVIALMEEDHQIGACQPKVLSYYRKDSFEYAGAAGGWIDALGYPFARGRVFDELEKDEGQYDREAAVFWASGAALFIRATLFHQCGGFDGYFFAHMEEIDLCWRLQLLGYTIMCCPSSIVYHVGGGTLPKGNYRKVYLNFRNNLVMLCKNLPWSEKIIKIPLRVMLDILFAFKSLLSGDGGSFLAVLKAHLHVVRWLFRAGKKKQQYRKRSMASLTGVYTGSIVYAHFIRKKKRFSEITKKKL